MKFRIEYLKNKIKGGYIGMNRLAAKAHNIPFHHKGNVIEIYKTSKPIMKATEKHEEIEYYLMKRRGLNYHKAHSIALEHENDKERLKTIIRKITNEE